MTNVLRHAQASEVVVALRDVDGGVRLIVRDNGAGCERGSGTAPASRACASGPCTSEADS
jgi:signal transduction histidine kinase